MNLPLYYYLLGTPLGLLGLIRWGAWLIRRIPAVLYRPIEGEHRASMAIVVPVYQEDPDIFATAIESWLANNVEQIILVIDASDTVCQDIARRYPVQVVITDVPGKRDALRKGWRAAHTELVALVDSDTIWAPDVADEVSKPFADPRIGGVGTRQSVYGSTGFLARVTDMFLDHRYFDENASQSLLGQAVSCLSGRTAIYRRHLLLEIEDEFLDETFWGVPCLSGDDKRLTTLILERGHRTYMQRSAEVWSIFPDTWKVFFRQRLRWARNTWRSDLRALSKPWVWRYPFLAYTMIDKGVSSFTLLLGPIFLVYSLFQQNWIFCLVLLAWWQISRSAKLLPHIRRRPSSLFLVLGYVVVSWVMALIKIQALLTVRKQRWLTRQVAVENGEVVRTTGPDETAADAAGDEPTPDKTVPLPVGRPLPPRRATSDLGMSGARTGRLVKDVKGVVAAALVLGIGVVAVAAAGPGSDPAQPGVLAAAALPVQQAPEPDADVPPAGSGSTSAGPRTAPGAATTKSTSGSSWERRGRPHRMVTVRTTSLDVVTDGQVTRRVAVGGSSVTLAELDRYLPASWLAIADGAATLSATVVLTSGTTLEIGGDVRTLQLAGGATPPDAASIHTGGGALTLTGVSVTSLDPTTGQPVPATAAGRPSIVASTGGRLDATDTTFANLGIPPTGTDDGRAGVVFNPGSTGSLIRATVQGGGIGLELLRSTGVHLTDVTVAESTDDGLVLSGDRGTVLSGIRAVGNGGRGVVVTGQNSDRPITGIMTTGNGQYGVAITGQTGTHITGVTTASDRAGGLDISRSTDLVVTDFTATDQRIGVFTHVYSSGIVLERIRTNGGRWGVAVQKSTHDVQIIDSTFYNAGVAGVTVGGQQVALNRVHVQDAQAGVRVERDAGDVQLTDVTVSGGRDGVVAMTGSTGLVVTGLVADYVSADAIRTASPDTRIVGGRITSGQTGIDAEAATTIIDTTIIAAEQGIRSRSPDLVQAAGVTIHTLDVGINAAEGSPFVLADSQVQALQSVRGEPTYQGVNDLSLPPFDVISVIGLPLIVLAIVLEEIHTIRQRRRRGGRDRRPPALRVGTV